MQYIYIYICICIPPYTAVNGCTLTHIIHNTHACECTVYYTSHSVSTTHTHTCARTLAVYYTPHSVSTTLTHVWAYTSGVLHNITFASCLVSVRKLNLKILIYATNKVRCIRINVDLTSGGRHCAAMGPILIAAAGTARYRGVE